MEKIIITGAYGNIGRLLCQELVDYQITALDLPEVDVRNYKKLLEIFPGHDAIIHLAWDTKIDNWTSGRVNPDNLLVVYNVYQAAAEAGVSRVIMASSVHADSFRGWKNRELISLDKIPIPDSPYGAGKIFMESLGRYFANKGLEVVCVRFGGLRPNAEAYDNDYYERAIWLSHKDCISLVTTIIEAEFIPDKFFIVYGISNNKNRIHDYSNPLGWEPEDDVEDFEK